MRLAGRGGTRAIFFDDVHPSESPLVLAGEALLEHGVDLNLARDPYPMGIEEH